MNGSWFGLGPYAYVSPVDHIFFSSMAFRWKSNTHDCQCLDGSTVCYEFMMWSVIHLVLSFDMMFCGQVHDRWLVLRILVWYQWVLSTSSVVLKTDVDEGVSLRSHIFLLQCYQATWSIQMEYTSIKLVLHVYHRKSYDLRSGLQFNPALLMPFLLARWKCVTISSGDQIHCYNLQVEYLSWAWDCHATSLRHEVLEVTWCWFWVFRLLFSGWNRNRL